ncbi:MAG TPA: thioredoxin domain-containing protein [Polyangia bacterium]|nr:thioredoxin domain-containing protein [Polyangia bacterium]
MSKGTAVVLMVVALAGGYGLKSLVTSDSDKGDKKEAAQGSAPKAAAPAPVADKAADGVERFRVPLEGPARGPASAKVNIVAFSDFQCPFCSRVVPTIDKLMKDYPTQVRFYFRHNPLEFHQDAPLASQAALAAEAQGKFWEMHDKLFANQQNIKRPDLEKYAKELGLDMGKFKSALDNGTYKGRIDTDMALARQIGVQGTPNFYLNGRNIQGAQPYEEFKKVVDDEIARADKILAKGTPVSQLYATFMQSAKTGPSAAPAAPTPAKAPAAGTEVYKVAVGDAPTKGGKNPKVTIIEFSEFQCPFCSRVSPTLTQVLKDYGDDVQIAFRHNPLPFHNNAMIASIAAEAAREQGKFWEMHDKLFANQQNLDRPNLEKYAQELGLNMNKFKAALDGEKNKDRIKKDMDDAANFGARGTPNFFINGHNFRGAQPLENFKSVINDEIKKADEKLKGGVTRAHLYAELTKDGLTKAAAPAPQQRPGEADAGTVYRADIKGAPLKGAKDALVTIVQFSDYQCPFCSRVEPTLNKVMEDYKGKVRVAWRDLPLPFHPNAMPAAIAARAAGEQGKYWEMHDKIFANQQTMDRPTYEKYAQELGLNMGKFKAALDSQKGKTDIEADAAAGNKIGARGTPAFFINGKFLSGAQPYEMFKSKIDDELKTAEALVAKGTPKAKVYDVLMKDAKTEIAAAPAAAEAEKGPEADTTVYKVDPGSAPSKGPKNAALTMVIFSDFQCPFCSRVEPTLTQIEKDYGGKVRQVWKNYPLPFHNNAEPAAEAAMAAGAQGKFWEMHDKLFANQQSLDRPSLEKYAQELGLNMSKFKADLDGQKYKAQIEADTKEGQAVGVNGTPAVFINGRKIAGAYPLETFKKIVDDELAKKEGGGKHAVVAKRKT